LNAKPLLQFFIKHGTAACLDVRWESLGPFEAYRSRSICGQIIDAPSQNEEGINLKTWIGFLRSELLERLAPFSLEAECDFHFLEEDGEIYIPLAAWLVAVAQEHFAFFSAQETAGVGQPHVDGEALEGVREESGLVDLIQRMSHVESVLDFQQDRMRTLVAQRSASPVTQTLGAAHSCTQGQECSPTTFEATIYIWIGHLLKAVEDCSLTWMQRLCKQQFKLWHLIREPAADGGSGGSCRTRRRKRCKTCGGADFWAFCHNKRTLWRRKPKSKTMLDFQNLPEILGSPWTS